MRAVDARTWAWVDVEQAVDDDDVTGVGGYRRGKGRVVVDLQAVARGGFDLQVLMGADLDRVGGEGAVERHLDASVTGGDVLVKRRVVGRVAIGRTATSGQQEDANQR